MDGRVASWLASWLAGWLTHARTWLATACLPAGSTAQVGQQGSAATLALLEGLSAEQSGAGGWNAIIKPQLRYANVSAPVNGTIRLQLPQLCDECGEFSIDSPETVRPGLRDQASRVQGFRAPDSGFKGSELRIQVQGLRAASVSVGSPETARLVIPAEPDPNPIPNPNPNPYPNADPDPDPNPRPPFTLSLTRSLSLSLTPAPALTLHLHPGAARRTRGGRAVRRLHLRRWHPRDQRLRR